MLQNDAISTDEAINEAVNDTISTDKATNDAINITVAILLQSNTPPS